MNILIIEDNEFLWEKIKEFFEKKNISNRIKITESYEKFIREIPVIKSYDIILVDILLWNKNKNWIDIIKAIREENKSIPIIIISWLDELSRIEEWFDAWANDYIFKPFRIKELEIRVHKWFKMFFYSDKSNTSNIIDYNWLSYNIKENIFHYNWVLLDLTKWNKYLLSIFLSNPEKVLSENFLSEKIWWDVWFVIERNLRVNILRLKESIKSTWISSWIKNVRGEWYILKK